MNYVVLMGRLTNDPNVRYSGSTMVARYTLAVDRRFKRDGEQAADFIGCVAFGKGAEFAEKYLHKGTKILVEGHIQTGSYDKDGKKVYTTDVIVSSHEFAESRNGGGGSAPASAQKPANASNDSFMEIPDSIDSEVPFV